MPGKPIIKQIIPAITFLIVVAGIFTGWLVFGPDPEEEPDAFYQTTAQRIASVYKEFRYSRKSSASNTLQALDLMLLQGAIDDVPVSPQMNIPCDSHKVRCIVYVVGGSIAYSLQQEFNSNNSNQYVNFTVIPDKASHRPASILLFSDGRIVSGQHYREGFAGKNGLPIIKTDPDYVQAN